MAERLVDPKLIVDEFKKLPTPGVLLDTFLENALDPLVGHQVHSEYQLSAAIKKHVPAWMLLKGANQSDIDQGLILMIYKGEMRSSEELIAQVVAGMRPTSYGWGERGEKRANNLVPTVQMKIYQTLYSSSSLTSWVLEALTKVNNKSLEFVL